MEHCNIQDVIDELNGISEADAQLLRHAYDYAKKAHDGQQRKSGEPYFIHVFATAKNLARYRMDPVTVAAGFLHDVIEDTSVTEDDMRREFGEEITTLVKGVTKLGHVKYSGRERNLESLRKFLMALAQDHRVLMIKLADRLHNLQTLEHVRKDKQERIALESIEVYAPLADRLGIGRLKGEIEDAAFPYLNPKESQNIEKLLEERKDSMQQSLTSVNEKLAEELKKYPFKIHSIDYRIKHKYSLWKKLQKKGASMDTVYDLVAVRIIVETVEECYAVLGIIHSIWKPLPGRIKDYIALPKLNGYQSLHTTIFTGEGGIVEVQIRTSKMHRRAELGIASHYSYKETSEGAHNDPKFRWVKEFKHLGETVPESNDFFKHLKNDLFNDRIFVFTPKGDVIDLPIGATPIDFAYAIHTDVGHKASGARINGKFVSLDTVIHSSDIVEIVTRKDGEPKSRWLDYAKTNSAKKHIRMYLSENKENGILSRFLPKKFRN
jgi:GTP pyrophosphokinase